MNLASTDNDNEQFSNLGYLYNLMVELRSTNANSQTVQLLREYKCGNPNTTEFKAASLFTEGEFGFELTFHLDIMTFDSSIPAGEQAKVFRLTATPDGKRFGQILPYPYTRP